MTFRSSLLALAVAGASITPGLGREAVVGLSPNQSPQALQKQIERVFQHLVQTVQPGERAHFFDADKVQLIGTFAVPMGEAYTNPRAKLQANRPVLGALKRFIDGAQAVPGGENRIDLPGLFATVRQNYPTEGADLIVLGSPIADDPRAPSVSMKPNRVGNDGHVAAGTGQSIYGTAGLPGTMANYTIYFGTTKPDWAVSPQHAYHVERFWSLSAEGHGGSMRYFGGDLETLFGLAGREAKPRRHSAPLVATDKLEMLQFAADRAQVPDIYSQPLQTAPAPEPVWRRASAVRIGITWQCDGCDLDLYVRPSPQAKVIFYNQATTAEGRLYKDFTNSPASGFETVELAVPVDLSAMRIAVNFYGGHSDGGPVNGELRLAIGSQVWAVPFAIAAQRGNRSDGAETALVDGVVPNEGWVLIDPMAVIGAAP